MMLKNKILVSAFVLGISASGFSDKAIAEDLSTVYQMAITGNPNISLAEEQVSEGVARQTNAFMGYLPEVSATFDREWVKQRIDRSDNTVFALGKGNFDNRRRTFQLQQHIFNFETIMNIVSSDMGRMRLKESLETAKQDVGYQAIEAYLSTLAAADDARLARIEHASMAERQVDVSARQKQGLATSYEADLVEARLAETDARVVATRTSYQRSFAQLQRRVGNLPASLATLARDVALPKLDDINVDDWLDAALKTSPRVRAMDYSIDERRAALAADVGQAMPTFDFIFTDTRLDSGGSLFGGGSLTHEGVAMLRLNVPLFNPGGRGYEALETRSQVDQARYQRAIYLRELRETVSGTITELVNGPDRIKALVKGVQTHRRIVDAVKIKFDAGQSTVLDVLDEDEDLFAMERQALAAIYSHLLNYALIHQVTGTLGQEQVTSINQLLDPTLPMITAGTDFSQYGHDTMPISVQ
ncbi:TolC family protein [uncultured Thalassospira sp.]|jgi:outer membrane protein TolC|uniref:TolC family protein n=1 Tax=uncultured Thalassospira sp. TaxID=404382 RepID=UPI0030DDB947|tara:strand:- start:7870 stop:9288 length:1419 start_codon:yes stop_codon:yes gene_type:complete